jgi:parallel beta-helix repeat protein
MRPFIATMTRRRSFRFGVPALLLAIAALAAPAGAERPTRRTLHVDRHHAASTDDGHGAAHAPFRTMAAAARAAKPGDTVRIAPGVYREAVLLDHGGEAGAPITFEAAVAGEVVVSGADVLTGWVRETGGKPIYTTVWTHDFIARPSLQGIEARMRGSQKPVAPVHCAEMFICQGRPLRQVLTASELAPGTFFVNWDADTVSVFLPDGGDPNVYPVEGASRATLFAARREGGAPHIAAKGIVFRHGATWAQQALVICSANWQLEDCVFEWSNGRGLTLRDGARILRCIGQDNGQMGFGGGGRDVLVKDCTLRRNNWKGYNVSWEAGGCKFVKVDGMRLENMTSYENTGHGIWFDIDNRNFTITGCTAYANHGLDRDHQGSGIFIEISPGPALVEKNVCYGNTGPGIKLAESTHVTVRDNLLVGNGSGVEFRYMIAREYAFGHIKIEGNRIKGSRVAALRTEGTHWSLADAAKYNVIVNGNTYDVRGGERTLVAWAASKLDSLADVRAALAFERDGTIGEIAFDRPLAPVKSRRARADESMDRALAGRQPGDRVVLPAYGRATPGGAAARIVVYDLASRHVTLHTTDAALREKVRQAVPPYPGNLPVYIEARLLATNGGLVEAEPLGVVAAPNSD